MVGLELVLFLVADEAEIGGGNGHGAGCRQLAGEVPTISYQGTQPPGSLPAPQPGLAEVTHRGAHT
jgi:hypothetical protein